MLSRCTLALAVAPVKTHHSCCKVAPSGVCFASSVGCFLQLRMQHHDNISNFLVSFILCATETFHLRGLWSGSQCYCVGRAALSPDSGGIIQPLWRPQLFTQTTTTTLSEPKGFHFLSVHVELRTSDLSVHQSSPSFLLIEDCHTRFHHHPLSA